MALAIIHNALPRQFDFLNRNVALILQESNQNSVTKGHGIPAEGVAV
jgi:hypothetical protein